ncbi:MAG: tRNA uridine-5-carboxymethylaminomethyl(34) synthesis GTPase MnmE, partial [Clostridia bacterium]
YIVDRKQRKVDQVLVSYFQNPFSFTGEDVCEINCHGGRRITLEVLEIVLANGARLAEPGEFTKRAFLNGKVDLTQAEAIMDVIAAKTKKQTKIANEQLEGKLSKEIGKINLELTTLMAQIEVSVDYPEYEYTEIESSEIVNRLTVCNDSIKKLISTYDEGKIIKDGITVAIIGRPNVGKSSLLNKLAECEKAIVTDIAGTTRDVIEETINIGELVLNIADTAGLRETDDVVEKIGVERSRKALESADLVIYMTDSIAGLNDEDIENIKNLSARNTIVLLNKIDEVDNMVIIDMYKKISRENLSIIPVSVLEDIGIDELKNDITKMYNNNKFDLENDVIITNQRHKSLLVKCSQGLQSSIDTINLGMPIEIITIEIRMAMQFLGEIIGTNVSDSVINKIFEKFCLGK